MNVNFQKAGEAAVSVQKKGAGMYGLLVFFLVDINPTHASGSSVKETCAKVFKACEKAFAQENPKAEKLGSIGSYRSAKTVLLQAVEYGVQVLDANGKPRGKTEVEKELAAMKEPKTSMDKFKAAMTTADKMVDDLVGTSELALAYSLAKTLHDKLVHTYAEVAKIAA